MEAIIVCLPKAVEWDIYKKELKEVESEDKVMNFKVAFLPKRLPVGTKCYVAHRGKVVGWMKVCSTLNDGKFKCSVTGKEWTGLFIQRTGKFHYLKKEVLLKSFRGWWYCEDFEES